MQQATGSLDEESVRIANTHNRQRRRHETIYERLLVEDTGIDGTEHLKLLKLEPKRGSCNRDRMRSPKGLTNL